MTPDNQTQNNDETADESAADSTEAVDVDLNAMDDIVTSAEEGAEQDPLYRLLGHPTKVKLLIAFRDAFPQAINPTRACEMVGISQRSWYDHIDDLLDTEIVEQAGSAGNSPLYALVEDDPRTKWLFRISDVTNKILYLDGVDGDEDSSS